MCLWHSGASVHPGWKKKSCHWFCSVLTVVTALVLAVNLPAEHLQRYVSARQLKSLFVILQVVTGKWYKGWKLISFTEHLQLYACCWIMEKSGWRNTTDLPWRPWDQVRGMKSSSEKDGGVLASEMKVPEELGWPDGMWLKIDDEALSGFSDTFSAEGETNWS